MQPSDVRRFSIESAVFVCGAMVMAFEIVASRILAPFIGTSTYTWTSLIGVILASLSLGYWLGGRMADRRPDVRVLAGIIFISAGLIAVTELIKEVVLSFISSAQIGIEMRSLAAAAILFAPASVCLGLVTPFAVKLKISSLADSGKTVGRLYALSTVGSIAGTFAAGFFLVPFVGSTRTLYLISASLIAVSIFLFPLKADRLSIGAILVFILSIAGNEATIYLMRTKADVHDIDTEYSRIRVFTTTDKRTGRPIRAIATDPFAIQSARFLDSDETVFEYNRYYHLVRYFNPDFRRVLVIGGAGYSVPKDLLTKYPQVEIDVVEIDPQMTVIARQYFGLQNDRRMSVIHEDGRTFINHAPDGHYDAVMIDAFGSLFSVPYQLTTKECIGQLKRSLTSHGVVILNLGSAISGKGSKFLHAELATYKSDFKNVYLFKIYPEIDDDRVQNLMIAAGKADILPEIPQGDVEIDRLWAHLYRSSVDSGVSPLTDDLAPVEYYNAIAQDMRIAEHY